MVLAIPGPVIAAFITITMAGIFIIGTKVILQGGLDYRGTLIAGVSFWVGVGFQNGAVFPEHLSGFAGGLLENGMMAGGFTAIAMTALMELTKPRPSRLEVECDLSGPGRNPGVHPRIRVAKRLGRSHGGPPRRRRRGDSAHAPGPGGGRVKNPSGAGCSSSRAARTAARLSSSSPRKGRRIFRTG